MLKKQLLIKERLKPSPGRAEELTVAAAALVQRQQLEIENLHQQFAERQKLLDQEHKDSSERLETASASQAQKKKRKKGKKKGKKPSPEVIELLRERRRVVREVRDRFRLEREQFIASLNPVETDFFFDSHEESWVELIPK